MCARCVSSEAVRGVWKGGRGKAPLDYLISIRHICKWAGPGSAQQYEKIKALACVFPCWARIVFGRQGCYAPHECVYCSGSHTCSARHLHYVRDLGEAFNRTRETALLLQQYSDVHRAQTKWNVATDNARSSLYYRLSTPEESTLRSHVFEVGQALGEGCLPNERPSGPFCLDGA